MDELAPLALGIALFILIAAIVKTISDNKTKRRLIEKGVVDDKLTTLFDERPELRIVAVLKWAFVLIGIGAAVLLGQLAPQHQSREYMMALMFLFAGIGLVLYYVIARHTFKSK
ncbi:MAG: hypothetical protein AMJ46_11570 [Latescibacteria bacterium DG_63]|nr:MAG: hypothetical protein AMJ46_11570 [Latescibacteria bacterium DG_63]